MNNHDERWRKRRKNKPPDSTSFRILNKERDPWYRRRNGKRSPGSLIWEILVREDPRTLGAAYAVVKNKKLKDRTSRADDGIWGHIAWVDTLNEEEGFPFVKIG